MKEQGLKKLREKATAIYYEQGTDFNKMSAQDKEALLQELQISKIELELQNEELQRAQTALEKSQLRFSRLFHKAPLGFIVLNESGLIVQSNNTITEMLHCGTGSLEGKAFADLIAQEDRPVFRARFRSIFKNPERKKLELRMTPEKGALFYAGIETAPFRCDSSEGSSGAELLLSIQDITERKEAEEHINDLLDEKEMLLKEVHHRIKNNMTTINGLLAIKASQSANPEVKNALSSAIKRLDTMRVLYKKLYTSSWYQTISAKGYLEELIREIHSIFPRRDSIQLNTEIDDIDLPPPIIAPLGLMVNELVTNAMKYAFPEDRTGSITIFLRRDKRAGGLSLRVSDDGIGVEACSDEESDGFGLQLVHMLAEQLNGQVDVENREGCIFTVTFALEA